ncbi:hypothetical protein HFD88_008687 [Aspergillus terreus]|nr:hypothetical protein HFD88_008687 [Aspergillus terreus]
MASSDCSRPPSTQMVPFEFKGREEPSHVLDPDGDVVIVLVKSTKNRATDASLNGSPDDESKEENPEEKPQGVRIRVSSKHLALASPYFKRMLGPNWEEGKSLRAAGSTSITATDFDLGALLVVLNAIHGRQDHLPRKLSLEMLAKVAVVVDYYQCHGVVDMAKELWINNLKPSFPTTYTENATLWIWVAWVFSAAEEFESATTLAIRQCPGPFSPLGFPIPSVVISKFLVDCLISSPLTPNFSR